MHKRNEIVEAARQYIGVPWRHQGRQDKLGIDCAGIIVMVAKSLGYFVYDKVNYARRPNGFSFMQAFKDNMKQKPLTEMKIGDVLTFRENNYPCHCGIIGEDNEGNLTLIHAYAVKKKVWEELLEEGDWMKKRVACFEFYGVDD